MGHDLLRSLSKLAAWHAYAVWIFARFVDGAGDAPYLMPVARISTCYSRINAMVAALMPRATRPSFLPPRAPASAVYSHRIRYRRIDVTNHRSSKDWAHFSRCSVVAAFSIRCSRLSYTSEDSRSPTIVTLTYYHGGILPRRRLPASYYREHSSFSDFLSPRSVQYSTRHLTHSSGLPERRTVYSDLFLLRRPARRSVTPPLPRCVRSFDMTDACAARRAAAPLYPFAKGVHRPSFWRATLACGFVACCDYRCCVYG